MWVRILRTSTASVMKAMMRSSAPHIGQIRGSTVLCLASLQDALGQINDLANAGRLLTDCAGEDTRLREAALPNAAKSRRA